MKKTRLALYAYLLIIADILRKPLDDYIAEHLPQVRVIRLSERSGLIRARLAGAREAKADVLVFLDSHTECNVNWLPPLLGKTNATFLKY
jgi:polypeptide N-acetylgalactosaminyltransferase